MRARTVVAALGATLSMMAACGHATPPGGRMIKWAELAAVPAPPATRIAYGTGPLHFGDLRLPRGRGPFPVAVIIHGGCWRSAYDLGPYGVMAASLAAAGIATWNVEYRRLGDDGGGWPGTFEDVARATDHVARLAEHYPLDLRRVILVGHSAGGQLALWLAARATPVPNDPAPTLSPLHVRGVVSLAGVTDLAAFGAGGGGCNASVTPLLGGPSVEQPARNAAASPIARLPLGIPVRLVHGAADPIVPVAQSEVYATRARSLGDDATVTLVDAAGHFDLIAPSAAAWPVVRAVIVRMARGR
jgi:acetyl esterase/lipase